MRVFTLSVIVFLTQIVVMPPAHSLSRQELKIGISQEFENLNPLIATMSATFYIISAVNRTLTTIDSNGKWVPQLAKSIPTFENGGAKLSPDKKQLTAVWEILDSAQWGDGQPVTCADFWFARQVAASANVSIGEKETYTQVIKIDWPANQPKKCTFTYEKARFDYYQLGRFYALPKHLEEPIFEKYQNVKEGYEKNSNFSKSPNNPGLYNGPYLISEVKLGSHVTLVPNPRFFGKAPQFQKVIIKLIPNTGTLEANLRSQTIDKISTLGMTFDQAIAFDKKNRSEKLGFEVVFQPSLIYEHIDLNLENPLIKDSRVRKALVYAINRQELVSALFSGKQTSAIHALPPMDPWYTEDPKKIVIYPHSKREAARLLTEAGWLLNPKDGYRYKDGKKLSLQLMTTAGNKNRETVQTFLQGQWKTVGVEVIIKNEPARVFFGETTKKRRFGAMAMYAWTSSPEQSPRAIFSCGSIPTEKNGWSGQNNMSWCNRHVDQLIEKIETEFDAQKRAQYAHQIMRYYTDEVPVIPLYYRSDIAVIPQQLRNFKLSGHQFAETNEIEDWNIQ